MFVLLVEWLAGGIMTLSTLIEPSDNLGNEILPQLRHAHQITVQKEESEADVL
jgi:hypothetical protein